MNAVQTVRNAVTKDKIKHMLETHGATHITDTGDTFRSTCPLHHGDNPTGFVWNYENGLWFCFTSDCGGGDIFDFVADINDLSIEHDFKTIVKDAALFLEIDITNLEMGQRADRNVKELNSWIEFVARKQRVINPKYDLNKLGRFFKLNAYREFTLETLDHFFVRYSEVFNRILIPLFNENNECVGASMRRIDESEPSKWLHRPKHVNTREIIYNLNNIGLNSECIVLTEGCFDVMNLHQIGVLNSGATFGAHLTEEQLILILKRFTDVILMYDGDEAGIKATLKAITMLRNKVNLRCYDLSLTEYHDPGEIPDMATFMNLPLYPAYMFEENHKEFVKNGSNKKS